MQPLSNSSVGEKKTYIQGNSSITFYAQSGQKHENNTYNIYIYYTLHFYFPYLSSLAQPVNIKLYGPGLNCLVFDSIL